jgi:hypothetical protein
MNEEKLEQILNKMGRADIPPNAALIAERASRNFDAALKIAQPRQWFFTPVRLMAAAAVIIFVFTVGRWSQPPQAQLSSLDLYAYASFLMTHPTAQQDKDSFWRQKALAVMLPRPYTKNQLSQTALLNVYKQYRKEYTFNKGE